MSTSTAHSRLTESTTSSSSFPERLARRVLFRQLGALERGGLQVIDAMGREFFGNASSALQGTVRVHDPSFYPRLLTGGNVGAGETYIDALWSTDSLTKVVQVLAANQDVLARVDGGTSWWTKPAHRLAHWLRRNSLAGSRKNIRAHYDLGNEFFELFLDDTMSYSCAYFPRPAATLHEASLAKLERVCRKLRLGPSDHLLEIGSGWGGLACYAATRYGCRVTTTTISRRQYEYATAAIQRRGLADRVRVLLEDYRQLSGSYDKLVSIEMIEAVGHHYFDTYFRAASRLLRNHGLMLVQAITMPDRLYERSRRSVDFIKQYIFPGSCLPSIGAMAESVGRASDLRLVSIEDLTPHYAETLRRWRLAFMARLADVRSQGFDERFIRMWEYYLCYCEGGFRERVIGDQQLLLAKPAWRGDAW
jgi:cyclopropane-fatty-acyl-phospholipid synthase